MQSARAPARFVRWQKYVYEAGKNRLKYSGSSINPVRRETNLRSPFFFFFFIFILFYFFFSQIRLSPSVKLVISKSTTSTLVYYIDFDNGVNIASRMTRVVLDYRSRCECLPRIFSISSEFSGICARWKCH